jgi:cytochrome P450
VSPAARSCCDLADDIRVTVGVVADPPVMDLDPFSDEFLREPEPFHARMRDAGPVIFLPRYGVWAMARYAEVRTALRDHRAYCSSAGVGLSDFRKEKPWRPPSLLLEADRPAHTRARRVTANRDPREWQDPDTFDMRRHAAGHVGFGSGIHACVRAAVARLEAEVLLAVLARQIRGIELAGPPRPRLNNTLKGLASLPLCAEPG